jgi:hypothetical protein
MVGTDIAAAARYGEAGVDVGLARRDMRVNIVEYLASVERLVEAQVQPAAACRMQALVFRGSCLPPV